MVMAKMFNEELHNLHCLPNSQVNENEMAGTYSKQWKFLTNFYSKM